MSKSETKLKDSKESTESANDVKNVKIDWIYIQRSFDAERNVDEIFYFLRELVDDLKICSSTECKIFHELHELDKFRGLFEDTFKFPLEAKSGFKNQIEYNKWKQDYEEYRFNAKSVFSKIFAMKTSKDTHEQEEIAHHIRFMEIVKEFTKSDKPMPADFTKGVQNQLDKYGKAITFDDPKVQNIAQEMQSQIKQSRKEKETEAKK